MNAYAIIPARGGSKRLPGKNILPLAGKPLISYSIEASLGSKYINKTFVTTDSEEIINVIQNYDINIIRRPEGLSTDTAKTIDVVIHAIQQLHEKPDYVVLLQPTSPLRTSKHIDEAFELLKRKSANAVISVCEMDHSPLWANTLPEDLSMEYFLPDSITEKRSQDLPKYYRINGAIYICKTDWLLEEKSFFLKKNIYAYIMSKAESIDIDDELDYLFAEILLNKNNSSRT
jgi:CMP-N-acetylneuraminic acid synthetase